MDDYLTILPSTHDELALDFAWYEQIRLELIRPLLRNTCRVLDVGTGNGGVLIGIADSIGSGVGIDMDPGVIGTAVARSRERDIRNLHFERADALSLPAASESYDLVLILGDTLSYAALFGRTQAVLSEARRTLRGGGTLVVDGMNWAWEYAHDPGWCFFLRGADGCYVFCTARRTPEGVETVQKSEVLVGSPLHEWLSRQGWPVAAGSDATTIDVQLHTPLPQAWLGESTCESSRYFTVETLTEELARSGFRDPRALCYGLTYDVVSGAGLTQMARPHMPALARSEARIARAASVGAGPWLIAWAAKPTSGCS